MSATHRIILNGRAIYVEDDGAVLRWLDSEQCRCCGGDEFTPVRLPRTKALLAVRCDRCGDESDAGRLC